VYNFDSKTSYRRKYQWSADNKKKYFNTSYDSKSQSNTKTKYKPTGINTRFIQKGSRTQSQKRNNPSSEGTKKSSPSPSRMASPPSRSPNKNDTSPKLVVCSSQKEKKHTSCISDPEKLNNTRQIHSSHAVDSMEISQQKQPKQSSPQKSRGQSVQTSIIPCISEQKICQKPNSVNKLHDKFQLHNTTIASLTAIFDQTLEPIIEIPKIPRNIIEEVVSWNESMEEGEPQHYNLENYADQVEYKDVKKMTVVELRSALQQMNLPKTGKKIVLVERLEEALRNKKSN